MYNFLAESLSYKVFSHEDYVYLKKKSNCHFPDKYDRNDITIGWIYGNPTGAIITHNEKHVIIAGCGLVIFDVLKAQGIQLFAEPNNITWTNALHQEDTDDIDSEFRYVVYSDKSIPQVFKMSIFTQEVLLLS
ncbi:MAG: hypothetical protein EOO37_02740 [Cytophagaceae bacterium]|nr:MAG: hypothetical protein EOO37_02740 [Cytophagaceae bacterium]